MVTEDQTATVEFLGSPATHGGVSVARVETHASIVFLAGARALKLKRAVKYDYLDFSTAAQRKTMCEAEIRVNRRTAPSLYRGIVAIVRRPDGSLALGGTGEPVDWVVEMNRFDENGLFDRLATGDALPVDLMAPLGAAIAQFHTRAERRPNHGGRRGIRWVIDGNTRGFAEEGEGIIDAHAAERLANASHHALARHGAHLDRRREAGSVRECHGDLHLRNIVLVDGRPTLFDAIEFNEEISCIDVLYDLAFLLMDLWRRRLPQHANAVLNAYLSETGDFAGAGLLPLLLSCRSAVRAKTSASAARLQTDAARRRELEDMARGYLELAGTLLNPPAPCLIAIGGFSGSGKSTLARALAPAVGAVPGALILRSDEVRKRRCRVSPLTRLGASGYTADVTRLVYKTIDERAATIIAGGHAAIADAVFARPPDRHAIEQVANAASIPFVGLWLEAPEHVLVSRSGGRQADPSDADPSVVRAQLAAGAGTIQWQRIPAAEGPDRVLQRAMRVIRMHMARAARAAHVRI
jgi:aminoglycoside phosphotransferase family enzyme/predicted kinase